MPRIRCITTAVAVIAIAMSIGSPLYAQAAASEQSVAADSAQTTIASVDTLIGTTTAAFTMVAPSPVALRALTSTTPESAPMMRERTSRSVAMMIVGGAALIVGSVVDGDSGTLIMVGGGIIGLIGLWNYLK